MSAWLPSSRLSAEGGASRPRMRLFCFPHAGGGASAFHRWVTSSPSDVEVLPVQLPGRENRLRERPLLSVGAIAEAAAPSILERTDVPYALFGHSLGALAAYEVARALVRSGGPPPRHLFVSGRRGPGCPALARPIRSLPDREFVKALQIVYGAPASFVEHPQLVLAFLPLLRADFTAGETYVHPRDGSMIDCPITALAGEDDPIAPPWSMQSWSRATSGAFALSTFRGGHGFWQDEAAAVHELVFGSLRSCSSRRQRVAQAERRT